MTYAPDTALALLIALPVLLTGAAIFLTLAIREGNRVHNLAEGQI
jgi:hypothetical protein